MQGLDIVFTPLALEPKTFPVGSTIRVTVSFKYTAPATITVKLKAGPYYTQLGFKRMVDSCVGSAEVSLLTAALQPVDKTATVDFPLIPKAQGGIEDGTYGLRVWIEGTNAVAEQDNIITVTGNPAGFDISSILPLMMVMMMMGMIMPMMEEEA
jgi:hypothetical protein